MTYKRKAIYRTVFILVGFMAALLGVVLNQHFGHKEDPEVFYGTQLSTPRPVEAFAFKDIHGQVFNQESLKGQWTLLFFGFTHCGGVCPTTMAILAQMMNQLQAKSLSPLPKVVMITIDPKRDHLDNLGRYVHAFHPYFSGARGTSQTVAALANSMGVMFEEIKNAKPSESFEHTGAIILVNPQAEVSAFFTPPLDPKKLAHDVSISVVKG